MASGAPHRFATRAGMMRAEAVSSRLKAPVDCRDAARLAGRWHHAVARADALSPAQWLDLLVAADALRRPERLDTLLAAASAHIAVLPRDARALSGERAAALAYAALSVVRGVDAAAIARDTRRGAQEAGRKAPDGDAIAAALRRARLAALREWKRRARKPRARTSRSGV
jgi:hypothetical protein